MGVTIQNVVPTSVSIGTPTVSSAAFNYFLILTDEARQEARTATYTTLASLVSAGYATTDETYKAANDILAQTSKDGKKVPAFKVGRKYKDQNSSIDISWDDDATAGTFTISVTKENGTAQTTAGIAYDANAAAVKSALELLTNVSEATVTLATGATQAGDKEGFNIEFTTADANTLFEVSAVDVSALTGVSTGTISQEYYGSATETWTAGITAVIADDNEFWGYVPTTVTKADLLLLAAYTETVKNKFMFGVTRDAEVLAGTADNIQDALRDAGYKKSMAVYNADTDHYLTAGWMGAVLPDFLGGVNPCYYPITGITVDDFTDSQITAMVAQNGNIYCALGGVNVITGTTAGQDGDVGGINASGQFIDLVFAKDYLETKISEDVYNLLVNQKKVQANATGIAQVDATIRATIQTEGVDRGIVVDGTVNTNLDTATVSALTRTITIPNGEMDAQGAVNKVEVTFDLVSN